MCLVVGVGNDVVKLKYLKLNGTLDIKSVSWSGISLIIKVSLTLAINADFDGDAWRSKLFAFPLVSGNNFHLN